MESKEDEDGSKDNNVDKNAKLLRKMDLEVARAKAVIMTVVKITTILKRVPMMMPMVITMQQALTMMLQ